jgi:hypothetical protein
MIYKNVLAIFWLQAKYESRIFKTYFYIFGYLLEASIEKYEIFS